MFDECPPYSSRHKRRDCVRMQNESRNSMVRAIFVLWWNVHPLIAGLMIKKMQRKPYSGWDIVKHE